MSDIFISYSSKDKELAKDLYDLIVSKNLTAFMAEMSIKPGMNWEEEILKKLKETKYVFFLASENSIKSAPVQQELGAFLIQDKNIIPLLIDIKPEDLPGWIKKHQAVDYNIKDEKINEIILDIKGNKLLGVLVSLGVLVWFLSKSK